MKLSLHHGDCLDVLRSLPSDSVDAVVTDPPAGISFMGREWDHHKGGRTQWVAWLAEVMGEVLRVCKPGAHAFVWALPRTSHWTMCAVEDAGWEIRQVVSHLFGTGFPKSHDVSKAIDQALGARRFRSARPDPPPLNGRASKATLGHGTGYSPDTCVGGDGDASATPEAAAWEGWGTALKPAVEFWILARKPLSGTVAANVLEWGTGALNIDGCRVVGAKTPAPERRGASAPAFLASRAHLGGDDSKGRWPPDLLLSHSPGCVRVGTRRIAGGSGWAESGSRGGPNAAMSGPNYDRGPKPDAFAADGLETVDDWRCVPGCPVAMLGEESGETPSGVNSTRGGRESDENYRLNSRIGDAVGFGDSGTVARYFPQFHYAPKVRAAERWGYCHTCGEVVAPERRKAHPRSKGHEVEYHPTQKSVELLRWLTRLILPPGGTVLDPFAGSFAEGEAAHAEGAGEFIGIDAHLPFVEIGRARLAEQTAQASLLPEIGARPAVERTPPPSAPKPSQGALGLELSE